MPSLYDRVLEYLPPHREDLQYVTMLERAASTHRVAITAMVSALLLLVLAGATISVSIGVAVVFVVFGFIVYSFAHQYWEEWEKYLSELERVAHDIAVADAMDFGEQLAQGANEREQGE